MTDSKYPAPPFDTELKPVLDAVLQAFNSSLHPEDIPALRSGGFTPGVEELVKGRPIEHFELTVPGPQGAPELLLSVFRRTDHVTPGPAFFFTHVGGLIFGDRFVGIAPIVNYVEQFDAVVVSVEYRLAPENPAPAQVEDAYAALKWTAEHADELGFDPAKLITVGGSAGGGLAAAVTLKARDDSNGPALAGQILMYPMLDDRNETVSSHQIDGIGVWDRTSNFTGWNAVLGDRRGTDDVTIYESPSRATDLSNLPHVHRGGQRGGLPRRERGVRLGHLGGGRLCRSAHLGRRIPSVRARCCGHRHRDCLPRSTHELGAPHPGAVEPPRLLRQRKAVRYRAPSQALRMSAPFVLQ